MLVLSPAPGTSARTQQAIVLASSSFHSSFAVSPGARLGQATHRRALQRGKLSLPAPGGAASEAARSKVAVHLGHRIQFDCLGGLDSLIEWNGCPC